MTAENLNLNQLRTFVAVARWGSFSRAAEHLYLSQPAVSAQIRALEQHFGTELIDVLGRKLYLTPAGETLLSYAQRIFGLAEEAGVVIDEIKGLKRGRLEVGASTTLGVYLLPEILGKFTAQYPEVDVYLDIGTNAQIARRVKVNILALGLVEAEVNDPTLLVTAFLEDELVLIVPPSHRWAQSGFATPVELSQEPFLMREAGSGTRTLVEAEFVRLQLPIKVVMELGNTEAIKRAVIASLGVSLVSKHAIRSELATGQLKVVQVPGMALRRTFSLIIHRDKRLPPVAKAFLGCLQEALAANGASLNGIRSL